MKIINSLKESGKKNIFLDDPLGLLSKEQLSQVWYEEIPEYKACVDKVSRRAEKYSLGNVCCQAERRLAGHYRFYLRCLIFRGLGEKRVPAE
jgi:hypothetical protein